MYLYKRSSRRLREASGFISYTRRTRRNESAVLPNTHMITKDIGAEPRSAIRREERKEISRETYWFALCLLCFTTHNWTKSTNWWKNMARLRDSPLSTTTMFTNLKAPLQWLQPWFIKGLWMWKIVQNWKHHQKKRKKGKGNQDGDADLFLWYFYTSRQFLLLKPKKWKFCTLTAATVMRRRSRNVSKWSFLQQ